ncbi:MAG: radical SAM protein [Myxococcota bacterium]
MFTRLSIELSQRCSKACWFCYSHSSAQGSTQWTADDLVAFVRDCAAHGVEAVSFGGGEPLESPLLWPVLEALRGQLFRSFTTNGLPLLDSATFDRVLEAQPDKVHVSIHFPGRLAEVQRVIEHVHALADAGIRSGINLLVQRSTLPASRDAARRLHDAGIDNERIVYLPMRGQDTPSPEELATVAAGPFQSMTCLQGCAASPRFCSLGWDRSVAWCSYTRSRRTLAEPTFSAMLDALLGLGLDYCGPEPTDPLVTLRRPASAATKAP